MPLLSAARDGLCSHRADVMLHALLCSPAGLMLPETLWKMTNKYCPQFPKTWFKSKYEEEYEWCNEQWLKRQPAS